MNEPEMDITKKVKNTLNAYNSILKSSMERKVDEIQIDNFYRRVECKVSEYYRDESELANHNPVYTPKILCEEGIQEITRKAWWEVETEKTKRYPQQKRGDGLARVQQELKRAIKEGELGLERKL